MLMPKKIKYRKQQRGRLNGKAWRGSRLAFGDYGLKALRSGRLTSREIEAARVAITRYMKRGGKLWIRIFPDRPFTKRGRGRWKAGWQQCGRDASSSREKG